jgi:hypothetical protein
MQLVVGSLISSRLVDFVANESERLGIKDNEPGDTQTATEDEEDELQNAKKAEKPKVMT